MEKGVYNLEFPSRCNSISINGYKFTRVDDYSERVLELQHMANICGEFNIVENTGKHVVTSIVYIPESEENAVFEWSEKKGTSLNDILVLLSLFTGRDVFLEERGINNSINKGVILADPRKYQYGDSLRVSIPYKDRVIDPEDPYLSCNGGFEEGINIVYSLIKTEEWQRTYKNGYFLLIARQAFKRQILETAFLQCWTIWEHLFTVLNRNWLSEGQIQKLSSNEKISYIMVKYALRGEIDKKSKDRISALSKIRNRLVHFGRFPKTETVYNDAILFIRLTEWILVIILGLRPSNVFNTIEKLENFFEKRL